MLRAALYYFTPLRRIALSIFAAHFGAISGHLLWQASYNPPKYWVADFASIITSSLFDIAGSLSFLSAVIWFSCLAPGMLLLVLAQLKILMLCITGKRWNCMLLAIYLSAIVLHFEFSWCWYVGDHTLFGWAFRK